MGRPFLGRVEFNVHWHHGRREPRRARGAGVAFSSRYPLSWSHFRASAAGEVVWPQTGTEWTAERAISAWAPTPMLMTTTIATDTCFNMAKPFQSA
jgi:hypothetical protein